MESNVILWKASSNLLNFQIQKCRKKSVSWSVKPQNLRAKRKSGGRRKSCIGKAWNTIDTEKNTSVCEVALQYNDGYNECVMTFANNMNTIEGGTHETGFKNALTKVINDYARKTGVIKGDDKGLSGDDVREGLVAIISVKLTDAQFESQTKAKLGNSEIRTLVDSIVDKKLEEYFDENPAQAKIIIEKAMAASDAMGDMKTLLDGAKTLIKLESLDKPESMLEDLSKSVYAPPPLYTPDVTKINSDLTPISAEQKEKLLRKYHVKKDKTQEMVEAKMGFFVPAGSTVPYEEYDEVDEENMFDEDDDDAL